MSGNKNSSILARPPKWSPRVSLAMGLVCIPLGAMIEGPLGGVLVGGGLGALVMSAWEFGRLRFVARRRANAKRAAGSVESSAEPGAAADGGSR